MILAIVLGVVAVVTALRMSSQPSVSPTVPQAKPQAAGNVQTPACALSFTVQPPTGPICTGLILHPNDTVITATSNSRVASASASLGFGALTYTFSATNTGGAGNGTIVPNATGPWEATWTAPNLLTVITPQTWIISAKVKDSLGRESTVGNCTQTLTYTPQIALKCQVVTITPNDPAIVGGSEARQLTATASGGVLPLNYTWAISSGSVDKGTLSSSTGQSVIWTGPGTVIASETWQITATVHDSAGNSDYSGCVVNLAANPPVAGCNSGCNSKSGCPSGLGCVNGQCRNANCPTESGCSCPQVSPSCNGDCTDSSQCPTSMACASGKCRNPSCTSQIGCVCPTTPTPSPTPTPTPTPQTHQECRNNACVVVTGAGTDTCTSDVSCRPVAVAPKIPVSGVELPTILGIIGGAGLLLLGFLVVL